MDTRGRANLSDLLQLTAHATNGGCRWRRGRCPLSDHDRLDAAAWLVADEIMVLRCGPARAIYDGWLATATGVTLTNSVDPTHAIPFVEPTFGLPPDGASLDHAQGYVAEVTWRMLAQGTTGGSLDSSPRAAGLRPATAPGADGFVIYRTHPAGELAFRLWEVKTRRVRLGLARR